MVRLLEPMPVWKAGADIEANNMSIKELDLWRRSLAQGRTPRNDRKTMENLLAWAIQQAGKIERVREIVEKIHPAHYGEGALPDIRDDLTNALRDVSDEFVRHEGPTCTRLNVPTFDVEDLWDQVLPLVNSRPVHSTGWDGISLDPEKYPAVKPILAALPGRRRRILIWRLEAGYRRGIHVDGPGKMGTENHQVMAIHIPLNTSDDCYTITQEEVDYRYIFRAGEAWYLDVTRPHGVYNDSKERRCVLLLDTFANDDLRVLLHGGERWHSQDSRTTV